MRPVPEGYKTNMAVVCWNGNQARHAHASKASHRNRLKMTKVDPVEQVLTTKCERLLRSNPNSMLMLIS